MTRSVLALTALGGALLLVPTPTFADEVSLRANVPFTFEVAGTVLSPGQYTFRFDDADMPGVLRVFSQNGHEGVFALTERAGLAADSTHAVLRFEKQGTRERLAQVVQPSAGFVVEPLGSAGVASGERKAGPGD